MHPHRTNSMTIRTPEGISFSFLLAGPVTRCMAWLLDGFVIGAMTTLMSYAFIIIGILGSDLMMAAMILGYVAISMGYGMVLEWFWHGQTLGKRLFKLRVMDSQGLQLHPSQIVIRNLLRFVDILPSLYLVGGLACLISKRAQRLGDLAANTIVVRMPEASEPDLKQLLSGKFNSFHAYPHLEARLRQQISPAEASLALQALLRRDELDPEERVALFHDLAQYFRDMVAFPQEATDGLSDEQYLRNVVDAIWSSKGEHSLKSGR